METTREENKRKSHDDTVKALNQLLEKNYDAEKGYRKAIEDADNPKLKTYFTRQAAHRAQYANELDKAIRGLNATPVDNSSTTSSLHRTWIDIKTAITGNDDEAVLEECIRGDKAARDEYQEVLDNETYLHEAKDIVRSQLQGIQNTLSTIKGLEDIED